MRLTILSVPSNMSKSEAIALLREDNIACDYTDIFSVRGHSILVEESKIELSKMLLDRKSIKV